MYITISITQHLSIHLLTKAIIPDKKFIPDSLITLSDEQQDLG